MKILRLWVLLAGIFPGLIFTAAATAKEKQLTLEDIVFDAKYLAEMLGPKTLVQTDLKEASILKVLKKAKLDQKTQVMFVPAEATPAKVAERINPQYPKQLRFGRDSGSASFLVLVGADGQVQSLYCYKYDERLMTLAAAMALVQWKFEPLKFGETALPVLTTVVLDYNATNMAMREAYIEGETFSNIVGPGRQSNQPQMGSPK